MKGLVVSVLIVAALAVAVSSPAARDPRLERLALSHADMQRASAAVLRESDLKAVPPGWRPLSTQPDNTAPICPWQNYSSFTLKGRGEADFQPTKIGHAGFIGSSVEILATPEDARGKFAVDTHPGTVSCEADALRKAFGTELKIASARQLPSPNLGERAIAYEFVYTQTKAIPKSIYVHMIEFVRGQGIAVLATTNFGTSGDTRTRVALARLIDNRLK